MLHVVLRQAVKRLTKELCKSEVQQINVAEQRHQLNKQTATSDCIAYLKNANAMIVTTATKGGLLLIGLLTV